MGLYIAGFGVFFLIMGVPIAFALGLTVLFTAMIWARIPMTLIYQQLYQAVDNFVLLAIPLFMLAGDLMLRAGIIDDIITLCNVLVGRLRGGLAHVNIVASMFFAGITGSAVSDTAALGSILIPSMRRNGYDADFAVAVTSASSVIGPIIPPSIGMVIYGTVVSVSIGGLFAGGMVPGILLGLGLMVVAYTISKKRDFGYSRVTYTGRELVRILLRSIPALMTPVIILGGIFGGVFTPTEAAGVAVTYSLLVGIFFYRTLNFKNILQAFEESMVLAASVLLIVAVSGPLAWLVAMDQIPQLIANIVTSLTTNPLIVLLLINVFLLLLGSVLDAAVIILIFAPILAPVAVAVGIDPLHFGIIFVLNVIIGLATPPFGMCLFVGASVGGIAVERVMKAILPFIAVEIVVLFLVTYVPDIAMTVPRLLGFAK